MGKKYETYTTAKYELTLQTKMLSPKHHEMARGTVDIDGGHVSSYQRELLADLPTVMVPYLGEAGLAALANSEEVTITRRCEDLLNHGLRGAIKGHVDDFADLEGLLGRIKGAKVQTEPTEEAELLVLFAADAKPVEARVTITPEPAQVRIRVAEPTENTPYRVARLVFTDGVVIVERDPNANSFWAARGASPV
ncbi:hypothetical protein AB0945_43780 [Streptomyces sp. NPDC005474]|uniref:hypothetical protein n=1 Tax=Streptomyces sp. NPDC005474 TaxID=3154878 RepID=UPI003455B444